MHSRCGVLARMAASDSLEFPLFVIQERKFKEKQRRRVEKTSIHRSSQCMLCSLVKTRTARLTWLMSEIMRAEKNHAGRKRPYTTQKKRSDGTTNGANGTNGATVNGVGHAPTRPSAVATRTNGNSVSEAVAAARGLSSSSIATRRFQDLQGLVDPIILKTITQDLKFDEMMPVQAASLEELLVKRTVCCHHHFTHLQLLTTV